MKARQTFLSAQLILVLNACLIAPSCSERTTTVETDWHKRDLKGKVQSIKEAQYNAVDKFGTVTKGDVTISRSSAQTSVQFNSDGYETELNWYNFDGSLKNRMRNSYKGSRIVSSKHFEADGQLYNEVRYEYDEQGRLLALVDLIEGEHYTTERYTYNDEGMVESISHFGADSSLQSVTIHARDLEGNEIETTTLEGEDTMSHVQYRYDNLGNKIESKHWSFGNYSGSFYYVYDANGNVIEETQDLPDGLYNGRTTTSYNEQGLVAERSSYTLHGRLEGTSKYEYEFDKIGNWTITIIYQDNKAMLILERLITYCVASA